MRAAEVAQLLDPSVNATPLPIRLGEEAKAKRKAEEAAHEAPKAQRKAEKRARQRADKLAAKNLVAVQQLARHAAAPGRPNGELARELCLKSHAAGGSQD